MEFRAFWNSLGFAVVLSAAAVHAQTDDWAAEPLDEIRAAAQKGDPAAQRSLGRRYAEGMGVPQDAVEAVKWYHKAAEQNHARAQFNLGLCYYSGEGVAKDAAEAVRWFRKAAEQNLAQAQFLLGHCYYKGEGVPQDAVEAVKWFRKAAEQNLDQAQFRLGACYAKGAGVPQDAVEAVKWYRKAAEQNLAQAQFRLGHCYYKGEGVPQDAVEAVKWFRKAAEQNLAQAQFRLGACYAKGAGVPQDIVEAVKWYRKAAERNHAQAQSNLGRCYYTGEGVPKDYVEAYKWFLLAAAQGNEYAKEMISEAEDSMTREQIAEGQKLARNFKPRKVPPPGTSLAPGVLMESRPETTGTGFFITEDGYLVTNKHVVRDATQVRVLTRAGLVAARVVKVDAANDLALLKAEGRFAALPVAPSRTVKLGATVATVGFPNIGLQGFAPKLAKGEIAALTGLQDDVRFFQISVPVQPGNSGGALVDERGNVVGVVSGKLNPLRALAETGTLPENVNYAVKSSYLLGFLESLPEVTAKLGEPVGKPARFEEVVTRAEAAAALVLVY